MITIVSKLYNGRAYFHKIWCIVILCPGIRPRIFLILTQSVFIGVNTEHFSNFECLFVC